jgi:hypothetical protein
MYVQIGTESSHLFYFAWNDADDLSTSLFCCLAYGMHQTGVMTSKDNGMAIPRRPTPEFFCHCEELGVDILVGGTENAEFHFLSFVGKIT